MTQQRGTWWLALMVVFPLALGDEAQAGLRPKAPRQVILLDGTWEVGEGSLESPPAEYGHKVVVPGLVDMAMPGFEEVGVTSAKRQAFWYRRTFKVPAAIPEVAMLKIHKARYGTKVYVNGQLAGEHLPCFTPGYVDVKPLLKSGGEENELVIRVGADRSVLPVGQPTGWDFEKYLYIPGIYDSVELVLTNKPTIVNVQVVPNLSAQSVRVVAEVEGAPESGAEVAIQVMAVRGGALAGKAKGATKAAEGAIQKLDVEVPIEGCHLWTPEDPFLYELRLSTGRDAAAVRFGMRSFGFDRERKMALLNGKPYPMRGTNVCVYRFFEDALRGDYPWRPDWVRLLHQKFKTMHWNSIRYCIGFPPELWYDIADEEGFLIQDEFPIWTLNDDPEKLESGKIIPEYIEWMRERWNHPCVVIWDAQNESKIAASGESLRAVRDLDLSRRPWENGWADPQSDMDCVESHPYLFIRDWQKQKPFRLSELASISTVPHLQDEQKKRDVPIIINEYDWLWLTRDGNPTCLTVEVYQHLLGPNSTVEQRRYARARNVAALTEFWRGHREAAGVLHFCGLGYSRPGDKPRPEGGATSDDFTDLETLSFEPHFAEYVGPAFNPVGLMVNYWAEEAKAGEKTRVDVYVLNDLHEEWRGPVSLKLARGDEVIREVSREVKVAPVGREIVTLDMEFPTEAGSYTLFAELKGAGDQRVRSLRDIRVIPSNGQ